MAKTGNITITTQIGWTVGTTEFNVTSTRTINDGQKPIQQVVDVLTASEVEILKIGSAGVAGELADINFVVITNLDQNNDCRIRLKDTGNDTSDHNLPPGGSFIFHNTDLNYSATGAVFAAYQTIDTIAAQFEIADGEIEITAGRV